MKIYIQITLAKIFSLMKRQGKIFKKILDLSEGIKDDKKDRI